MLCKYLLVIELRCDAILYSLRDENFDAGHFRCSRGPHLARGPHVPHPWVKPKTNTVSLSSMQRAYSGVLGLQEQKNDSCKVGRWVVSETRGCNHSTEQIPCCCTFLIIALKSLLFLSRWQSIPCIKFKAWISENPPFFMSLLCTLRNTCVILQHPWTPFRPFRDNLLEFTATRNRHILSYSCKNIVREVKLQKFQSNEKMFLQQYSAALIEMRKLLLTDDGSSGKK